MDLISPVVSRYSSVELKIDNIMNHIESRLREYETGMIVQEKTIEFIINSLQILSQNMNTGSNNP